MTDQPLVFVPADLCPQDIRRLRSLGSTAEQHDDLLAIFGIIKRYPGPDATRISNTPSPTAFASPKFPNMSRAIRSRMMALAFKSRSPLSQISKGHRPLASA
jgi:hypothetical protein